MAILNPNLREFWEPYSPIKLLYGGRDSSKTKDTALKMVLYATEGKLRIMCARQFQNRIEQSVYTEIKWAINRLGYDDYFTIYKNSIVCSSTGAEFFFYGIQRNLKEIKGTADIDILWIEEGEALSKDQWDDIEPTVRKDFSLIVVVFNPYLVTDFIWTSLVSSDRTDILKRHINYNENIFLSDKSKKRIAWLKENDYESYKHIYLGHPKQDNENAIIKREWLMSCVDAHIKLNIDGTGGKRIGYDVADSGEDKNAEALMDGAILTGIDLWDGGEDELYESAGRVHAQAVAHSAIVNYDENGVGAGVGSNMKQINGIKNERVEYHGFNSASAPRAPDSIYYIEGLPTQQTNREYFENMKAQAWWALRDRIIATHRAVERGETLHPDDLFSIDGSIDHIEQAITELSTPEKKQSARLKNMVERKKDLKKRGIKSPNIADAIVYANFDLSEPEYEVQENTISIF